MDLSSVDAKRGRNVKKIDLFWLPENPYSALPDYDGENPRAYAGQAAAYEHVKHKAFAEGVAATVEAIEAILDVRIAEILEER